MKMNRQMREMLSEQIYDEFKASKNKHQFFFDSTLKLFDYPKTAKKIAEFLIFEIKKEQQNPNLFSTIIDSQTLKSTNLTFENLGEKQSCLNDYIKLIEENLNLIEAEAKAQRYIEKNHDKFIKIPDINDKKYEGIVAETKDKQVQELFSAFLTKPYEVLFCMDKVLESHPKTALFFKDYLIADIKQSMKSYKDSVSAFDFELKKQSTFSFGWYYIRNQYLSELCNAVEQKYNEITHSKSESQPGDEDK